MAKPKHPEDLVETGKSVKLPRPYAPIGGRLWTALGVVAVTLGCAPPKPVNPASATDAMRTMVRAGSQPDSLLSVLRAGPTTGPRLIFVHGTPGSATAWTDYLLDPPEGAEIMALDRPGFGQSEPDGAVVSIEQQAKAVAALLPQGGRKAVLIGHSLGGPIVARVAADNPGQVAAVVLLAASLDPALEAIHPMQRVGAWTPVRTMLPRALRNANAELMALKPELEALARLLPSITARVVIVHGTKDDLVPVANVPFMQSHLTGARCVKTVLLEDRNHFLPWNSAPEVRAAIRTALEETC